MRISWPWSLAFDVLAEGATLAARQLCPMDHTGAQRRQAMRDAEEAAADALADAEAEIDVWEPSCGHPNHGNADHCCRPFLPCDGGCCKPVEDWPPVNAKCGCGREVYIGIDKTGELVNFHVDDDSPVTAECIFELSPKPSRAEETHADAPGEVTRPSPGDLTTAELIAELADVLETSARYATPRVPGLITEAKARAARPNVSHEDLAAHIVAQCYERMQFISVSAVDEIAASLLADYTITLK